MDIIVLSSVLVLMWCLSGLAFAIVRWEWLDGKKKIIDSMRHTAIDDALDEMKLKLPVGGTLKEVSPIIISATVKSISDNITEKKARKSFLITLTIAGFLGIILYISSRLIFVDSLLENRSPVTE